MSQEKPSYGWKRIMNKKKTKKEMSPNHNGPKGYKETLTQVKIRVELLNRFITEGVPDDFTAHKSLKALIAYSDGEYIEARSYPAIYAKKNVPILDIDPDYKGHPNTVVDCKDYLKFKIEQLKDALEEKINSQFKSGNNEIQDKKVDNNSTDNKSKIKTKSELRNTIKEQALVIESLAREVLLQRNANNSLVSLLREKDKSGRALKIYYDQHKQSLCNYRDHTTPDFQLIINNLKTISTEFDSELENSLDNVIHLWTE